MNKQLLLTLIEIDQLTTMAVMFSTDSAAWPCYLIKIVIPCNSNGCKCPSCPMGVWSGGYFQKLIKVFPHEPSTNGYPYGYKESK